MIFLNSSSSKLIIQNFSITSKNQNLRQPKDFDFLSEDFDKLSKVFDKLLKVLTNYWKFLTNC